MPTRTPAPTMSSRIAAAAFVAIALVIPASALAAGTLPIEQALDQLSTGDYFAVEGTIEKVTSDRLFTLSDDSGEMLVYIPEFVTREQGMPTRSERIRVWGKFDHKRLDPSVEGMRVSKLRRLGVEKGASGASNPTSSSAVVPIDSIKPPPAAITEPDVIRGHASDDLKRRYRGKIDAYERAQAEAQDAAETWARAVNAAGPNGEVSPPLVQRLETAEAQVEVMRAELPAIVQEAREAGVSESVLRMLERDAGLR